MIEPFTGVQSVIPLIDHIAESRPHLPPLIVGVISADEDESRTFVGGYKERLFDIKDRPLVPNAHAGAVTLRIARASVSPEIVLLDEIAKQLRSSVPAGAGRSWRPKRFAVCLDVLQADGVGRTTAEATREELLDWLYTRWEGRKKLLSWIRRMSDAELPSKIIGLVLLAMLHGPSRWWFARRLRSRNFRWLNEHVTKATGERGDFLGQAAYLLPDSALADVTALRRRILFDALLHDVSLFVRRHRFLPHRRRRRWTPVLLLDATDPLVAELVDLYDELTRSSTEMPLLVMAALDPAATTDTPVLDMDQAARALRSLANERESDRPRRIVLRLPRDSSPDPVAVSYLATHRRVTPRVPGRVSALAPLVLSMLLVAAGGGLAAYEYFGSGCADTRFNDLHERVGLIESGCSFDQPRSAPGVPDLTELEQRVFDNNAAVDQMRDGGNNKRYYREVVFFGPLTRPNVGERTAPPNAIWQLSGAVEAQRAHNEKAKLDNRKVPIKLVLANSGDRFTDGDWVASKIAERPRSGNGALAAVIGISQSRPDASKAIEDHLGDIPAIGSSMYGSKMRENENVFLTAPLNEAFADEMAEWLSREGHDPADTVVVYDPDDTYYSRELRNLLRERDIGSDETDIRITEGGNDVEDSEIVAMCEKEQIPVLTNRADQILKFLNRVGELTACDGRPMRILAGPGLIVEAATNTLERRYPWARISLTSLADTPAKSEESTGRDAFDFAAAAITETRDDAGEDWGPGQVQNVLEEQSEVFEGYGLPKLNDTEASGRIHIIQP